MIKKILGLFSLLLLLALSSCQTPTVFGVPEPTWKQLTPEQQQQIIENYNQRQMIAAQNAPLQAAINTAGNVLSHSNGVN